MRWAEFARPRDPALAARLAVGFTATAAVVQLINTVSSPPSGGSPGLLLSYGVPVLLMLVAAGLRVFAQRVPAPGWMVVPLLGVLAITVLDVTSHDASVEAQVFLFFPVLYAASQLGRPAAALLTGLSVAAELVITFSGEAAKSAALDSIYVCAGLAATAWLLLHSAGEQDRLVERLARLASVDPLTGLTTRRVLDEVARKAMAPDERRRRSGSRGTALLVIDLDLFKSVNDTYGHPVGDEFLVHAGRFVRRHCRPEDVVSRLGGDEFAVLMADCPYPAALERGRRLVELAESAPFLTPDGTALPLRFSVGVGHVPAGGAGGLRDLYNQADQALYQAKAVGRGRAG